MKEKNLYEKIQSLRDGEEIEIRKESRWYDQWTEKPRVTELYVQVVSDGWWKEEIFPPNVTEAELITRINKMFAVVRKRKREEK